MGLKAVNKPLLVVIGSKVENCSAKATKEFILKNSNGEIQTIDIAAHNGIKHNLSSFTFNKNWFLQL